MLRTLRNITLSLFLATGLVLGLTSAAGAGESYPAENPPPSVLGDEVVSDPPAVAAAAAARNESLPVTGSDVAGLVLIGLVAVGAGVVLVRVQRRSDA